MKKLFFAAMLAGATIFTSCSSSKADEQAREDSERRADSIEAVEAAAQRAERARQDSIRQDSIQKAEEFTAAIPTFREVQNVAFNANAQKSFFKKRGFKVSSSSQSVFSDVDGEMVKYTTVTATLEGPDGKSCKYKHNGEDKWSLTISGAPEILDNFAADAKAYANKKQKDMNEMDIFFSKSGDTVSISWPTN